jgi:hypothetical protein
MKKLFTLLVCSALSLPLFSQVSDAYKTQMESIFQVDRSYVTTGLLQDYGFYYTNVDKFNGVRSDTSYLEYGEFQSLYSSIYTYRFNSNQTLPDPLTLFAQIENSATQFNQTANGRTANALPSENEQSTVLLCGLHYNYERFKSTAVSSNLVFISNNIIYDQAGRPTTPYEIKEAFAIVPFRTQLKGTTQQFVFKSDAFFSNTGKTIGNIMIDFGEGFHTYAINTPVSYNFGSVGEKTIRFRLNYTDGTYMESHSKLNILESDNGTSGSPAGRYVGANVDSLDFPLNDGVTIAPKPYQGVVGRARVTIEYSGTDRVLRRPLIIVEGFDAWKILHADEPENNVSFEDMIFRFGDGRDGNLNVRIAEFGNQTLNDLLDNAGYDLIVIDFENGTDYIQRNAFVVQSVLRYVNRVKVAVEGAIQPNVILGFSMGGLVARYALRDMEVNGIAHNTRLNVSIDSPHQGANVPLGFQAAVTHLASSGIGVGLPGIGTYNPQSLTFGSLIKDLGNASELLNAPATRQMVLHQMVGGGDLLLYDNSQHTTFMNEYHQLGAPSQEGIRNVVLANGSECGVNQGFAAGAAFVNVDEKSKLEWWATLLSNIFGNLAFYTNYPQAAIGSGLTTRTDIRYQFKATALPSSGSQEIYRFKLSLKKKILFVININITLIDKSYFNPSGLLALDNAPGGIYDIGQVADLPITPLLTRFCFIPTFSALNIGNGSQTITPTDISSPYSYSFPPAAPKNVTAANFFTNPTEGGETNELHTQLTPRNGNWLFREITQNPLYTGCSYLCAGTSLAPSISGPPTLCTSATYTVTNRPADATVNWTSSNPSGVSINSSGVATKSSTFNGSITITAEIAGACGNSAPLTKTVWAGKPKQQLSVTEIDGPGKMDQNNLDYEYTVSDINATSYTWTLSNTKARIKSYSMTDNRINVRLRPDIYKEGTVDLFLSATNICGSISIGPRTLRVGPCPGTTNSTGCNSVLERTNPNSKDEREMDEYQVQLFPNPASSKLTVINEGISVNNIVEVVLYNQLQQVVYKGSMSSKSFDFDLTEVPNGVYILKVIKDGEVYTRKVLIEK